MILTKSEYIAKINSLLEDNSTQLTLEDGSTGLYINDTITQTTILKHNTIESIINSVISKHNIRSSSIKDN